MATKRQALQALKKIHKDAELECSFGRVWEAEIWAPPGHHWSEGPHSLVEHVGEGELKSKAEFWDRVLERLDGLEAWSCTDPETPCEFITMHGECEANPLIEEQ